MKLLGLRGLVGLLVLVLGLFSVSSAALAISVDDVLQLTKFGISKNEILKAIEKDRTVFNLPVQEILRLRKAGVHADVIKFMLSTPQRYGKKKAPGAETRAIQPPAEIHRKTAEEKAAEEARLRREAQRLAEEAKKAQETQRRAYAQGVLRRGKELADDGEFVASIQTFQKFLRDGSYTPQSEEYVIARYGVANALIKAKLYQSAAETLMEVLLAGPKTPFFQPAFHDLREIRKTVGYSPPELERLADFPVTEFSQGFQDEFYYVLGEFFYEQGNVEAALPYFKKISEGSSDYPKALYLTALVQVQNELYRSAAQTLEQAIVAAERVGSEDTLMELAYLALARIAYANSDYYAAVFYYRKIPVDSTRAPVAFYESAWAYFLNGDVQRALGMFHALHSPAFNHYFYPELWILEATVYLNTCNYKESRQAMNRFEKEVAVLAMPLKSFLRKAQTPMDTYKAVISTIAGETSYDLPRALTRPLLADVDFYNLYRTIRQVRAEEATLKPVEAKLGSFGRTLLAKLATARQNTVIRAGIRAQKVLREVGADVDRYTTNVTEIEVDLSNIEIEQIDEETRRLLDEDSQKSKGDVEAVSRGAIAIVGSDSLAWPFEGEFWVDETPYYRSLLKDRCTQ